MDPLGKLKYLFRYAVIALSLLTVFHFSARLQYFPAARPSDPGVLSRGYGVVVRFGERLGLGPRWRMYSPTQKHVFRVEWYASDPAGEWVRLEMPDLSRQHRRSRGCLSAWVWDFKLARVQDNYLRYFRQYHPALRRIYAQRQKRIIEKRTGQVVPRLRLKLRAAPIPPPREKGAWTPAEADYPMVVYDVIE